MNKLQDLEERKANIEKQLQKINQEIEVASYPEKKEDIDWLPVIDMAREIVNDIMAGRYHEDNDDPEYIFEGVMKAIYGDDFFVWMNDRT